MVGSPAGSPFLRSRLSRPVEQRRPLHLGSHSPNPAGELEILNRGGLITLRVRVARAPARHTFVLGSRWCSRGIWTRGNRFAIIGELPAAAVGWSDITDLYVKAFGVPPVGRRVFIRTRQLLNGWEDKFKETWADVPPPERQGS